MLNTFDKIKFALAKGSGKCVILDREEPRYVVMTWQEYEKLLNLVEDLKGRKELDIKDIPL